MDLDRIEFRGERGTKTASPSVERERRTLVALSSIPPIREKARFPLSLSPRNTWDRRGGGRDKDTAREENSFYPFSSFEFQSQEKSVKSV